MRRRDVVTALGAGTAGLGGCLTPGSGESTRTPPTCESPGPRRVALARTGETPAEANVSISATVERARPTAERPARVRILFTNEGRTRSVAPPDDRYCHVLNRADGRSEPRGLWLYRPERTPDDRAAPCWTAAEVPGDGSPRFLSYGCGRDVLDSGESVVYTYEVWDDHLTDGYLRPGPYRFDVSLSVPAGRSSAGEGTESDRVSADWWLDLEVTDPDR